MAKRFKLKFNIPSFQLCRSKSLSTFPGNPVPAIYRLSPVNPKAHDVGYLNLPAPLPSTQEQRCKASSKIVSVGNACHSRSRACKQHAPFNRCNPSSQEIIRCESTFCKMGSDKEKKVKARGKRSNLLIDSFDSHNEDESETLISCLTSFSDEFYHDEKTVQYSPGTASHETEKELISSHGKKISSVKKVRRLRFQASENRRGLETGQMKRTTVTSRATVTRCTVEGKMKESFAVVKKSKDPYEDFKKSMLEMIIEMEMFAAEDLEQLLQSFLALNSRSYHGVIVRAFMEIWKQLFCVNTASIKNLQAQVKSPTDLEE